MKRLRFRLLIAAYVLSLAITVFPASTTATASFTYNTNVTYRVEGDGSTSVTEDYAITNNTAREYLTELKLTTPTPVVTDLKATYNDGTAITAVAVAKEAHHGELQYPSHEITITFPRKLYGNGVTWKFRVSYTASGLVESKGSAHTVYVPAIDAGNLEDSYSVRIDAPADFGSPHFPGAQAASRGVESGRQFYTFNKADLVEHSLALAFGDTTIYDFNFNFPLKNESPFTKTLTVALPPDLNNQKAYINSLKPAPTNTRLDHDGNVLADYELAAHQEIIIKTDVAGEVKYLEYDLTSSLKRADIPTELVQTYTKPTRYWPQSPAIIEQAKKLKDDTAPVLNTVKATYQFVIDKLSYNADKIKFNIRQGASKALANPANAVCLEYADLMIALLRAEGIPARMPIGYAYSGSLKSSAAVADSLHAWVEAYVPGIGWMTIDPTWGEKFDGFGKSDLDHFAFAVWGEQDDRPAAVMAGTADTNYQYEKAAVSFASKVTAVTSKGALQINRFVLLPFLALDQITATAASQVVTDDNLLTIGSSKMELGSLAPGQKTVINQPVVGGDWNQAPAAQLAQGGAVLAATTVRVNYVYMWMFLGLLVALILVTVLRLRSNKRRRLQASPPLPAGQEQHGQSL